MQNIRGFLAAVLLVTAAILVNSAVSTQSFAQTSTIPAAGGWCGVPISGGGCYYYPSPGAACEAQHAYYEPAQDYYGYEDTTPYWSNKNCRWKVGPGVIYPATVFFVCPPNKNGVFGARCVTDDFTSRPDQNCNVGGSPTTPNPIDILTGAKRFRIDDFATADGSLNLTRLYSSAPYGGVELAAYSNPLGLANWHFQFDLELQLTNQMFYDRKVTLLTPDGGTYAFRKDATTAAIAPYAPASRPLPQVQYSLEFIGTWPSNLQNLGNSSTQWKVVDEDDNTWLLQTYLDSATGQYTRAVVTEFSTRAGATLTFARSTNGQLDSITDDHGKTISFDWLTGQGGRPLAISAAHLPSGYSINYIYNDNTQPEALTSVEYRDSASVLQDKVTYVYGDARFPTAVTEVQDKNNVAIWGVTYDDELRATQSTGPGGVGSHSISYSAPGATFTRTVTNALGKQEVYNYTRSASYYDQKLTGVTGLVSAHCPASASAVTYDSGGFLDSSTDEEGRVATFDWDTRGRPTQTVEASGTSSARTTTTTWHSTFNVPTQVVRPGLTTDYTYDTNGRLLTKTLTDTTTITTPYVTAGRTRVWTYTWSTTGQLLTVDGPLAGTGDTTTYGYTSDGYLQTITNPLSQVTTFTTVDWRGAPLTFTDANGVSTALTYDVRGRPLSVTINPGSAQSQYTLEYTPTGKLEKITSPGGAWLEYTYNAADQVTLVTNDRGETQAFTYDLAGNVLSRTVKDIASTITQEQTKAYDELGRTIASIGAAGALTQKTEFGYDKVSNLTSLTNPLSKVRLVDFDPLNRVILETDPENHTVEYAYAANDAVAKITDGNGYQTPYVVDGFGLTIQETSPDRGVRKYWYDAAGNLTKIIDGDGEETNHAYDDASRRTGTTFPGASVETIVYTYDGTTGGNQGIGRLTGVTEESGSTNYTYDEQGHVTTDARVIRGKSYAVGYSYNARGDVTQIVYPSGRLVLIARASDGAPTGVTMKANSGSAAVNVATGIDYEPFGPLKGLTFGNGLALNRTHDNNYWLTRTQVTDGAITPLDLGFQWYDDGRLGEVNDNASTGRDTLIAYSDAGRLSYASGPWGAHSYVYDAAGNRIEKQATIGGSTTVEYAIGPGTNNQITQVQDVSTAPIRNLTYRAGGDLYQDQAVGGPLYQYNYNARKRLVNVQENSVSKGSYGYDFLGRRVWRETFGTGASETHYVFDLDGRLLAEHDGATGAVIKEYIWVDDLPIAVVDSSSGSPQTYYIHAGQMNEPLVLTNGAKVKVWDAYVEPYGRAAFTPSTADIDLRLPGQWLQLEANGLHQNGWRDYDPSLARYIQADPLGLAPGQNPYAYVDGDPLNRSDPEGLGPKGAAIGAGVGFVVGTGVSLLADAGTAGVNIALTPAEIAFAVAGGAAIGNAIENVLFSETTRATQQSKSDARYCLPDKTDPCQPLYEQIDVAVRVLQRRNAQLIEDKLGLPATGKNSIAGHREAFTNWQSRLRRLLSQANAMGCLDYRKDAWLWATKATPTAQR